MKVFLKVTLLFYFNKKNSLKSGFHEAKQNVLKCLKLDMMTVGNIFANL